MYVPLPRLPAPPSSLRPAGRALAAFTLVELLTVIAVIGVLASVLFPALGLCRQAARKSREVSAAHHLMVAFQMAADDQKGVYLSLKDNPTATRNEQGQTVSIGAAGARWPHHLRPYLGNRFKATLYVNDQADYYDEILAAGPGPLTDYTLSLGTTFGMNGLFVGAVPASNIKDKPVRKIDEAALPARLIAFVSANGRAGPPANPNSGYFKIESPAIGWPADDPVFPTDPALDASYGYVAWRHGGRAVVCLLDGHVELLSCASLRDMRLWSDQARRQDKPGYRPLY